MDKNTGIEVGRGKLIHEGHTVELRWEKDKPGVDNYPKPYSELFKPKTK